jgi:hypothetical protein
MTRAELDSFVGYMKESSTLEGLLKGIKHRGGRTKSKEKQKKELRDFAYKRAVAYGDVDKAKVPNADAWNVREGNQYAARYGNLIHAEATQTASEEFDTKSKQRIILDQLVLEGIDRVLSNPKTEELIAAHAGPGYTDWRTHYVTYVNANDLAERAKSGRVTSDELKKLKEKAALAHGELSRKAMKKQGYDTDLQEEAFDLAYDAVMAGYKGVDIKEAARENAEDAEKMLRDYESTSGKDRKGYFKAGIMKIAEGNDDEFAVARNLTAEAGK